MRWMILALLFGATVLNQVDRQALSILARTIQDDLAISDLEYSYIVQAFLIFYAIGMLLTGKIADRIGVRLAAAAFLGFWSVAQMLTGLVNTAGQLGAARGMLALGEAGNYTAAPKAVADWFPARERGLAVGIYTSAGMLGAIIAPPLIGFSALAYGWRATFLWTGLAGIVWAIVFFLAYRNPPRRVAPGEDIDETAGKPTTLRALLRSPAIWRLFVARMLTDPVWYFYLFWFPKYLQDARDFSLADVAALGWIIYLAADIGSIAGGLFSGRLIARGSDPVAARVRVMLFVVGIAPLGLLLGLQPAIWLTLTLASLIAFIHLVWLTNLTSAIVDIFPRNKLGSAVGLISSGSAIGGAISSPIIGYLVTYYSYAPVFVLLGLLHPLGWLAVRKLAKP